MEIYLGKLAKLKQNYYLCKSKWVFSKLWTGSGDQDADLFDTRRQYPENDP